jgi:SpoVK/Ycf46/Vps4 family AAA+-type ATPase
MTDQTSNSELFEMNLPLPDADFQSLAKTLIGFDARFDRVGRSLQMLLDPGSVEKWAKKFHEPDLVVIELLAQRYPLVLLEGDVGTGKTQFAECASDRLARVNDRDGQLIKLSTRVRGTGQVGQMSTLINQAFAEVERLAGKQRLAFLIIDEADSLAANREAGNSHHEDKVGVNTLIQKIDNARKLGGRLLVFLCTNRPGSLDPALVRRAGGRERFDRPDDAERAALFAHDTRGLGISAEAIEEAVTLTGADANGGLGFTFSDLRTRLLPEAILRAFPDRPLTGDDLIEVARELAPSPSLIEQPRA